MNIARYISEKYKPAETSKSPIEVVNMSRADLAKLFAKFGFTKGAEVGSWTGKYTQILCAANPELKLHSIDLNGKTDKKTVPDNCKLLRMSSLDAARKVVDASLDFVYLDGDHDLTDSINDLQAWSKKVRVGGIIAGHDFFRYRQRTNLHSFEAVNAFTTAHRITPWYVIGRQADPIRSWFWVKA